MDLHKHVRRCLSGWCLAFWAGLILSCPGYAQSVTIPGNSVRPTTSATRSTPASANASSQVQRVLAQGMQLEQGGQWAEALRLYQKASREIPNHESLAHRRRIARIHYDLDRRYSDSSYLQSLARTRPGEATNIYSEVLLKIQSYYVDEPNWVELAGFGLTNLEIALRSPRFRQTNLPRATTEQIESAILQTRRRLHNVPVRSRQDAYLVASTVAKGMQRELNLSIQSTMFEFIAGAIAALDPYSAYMSGIQYSETMSQIEGNFVGLGVELNTHHDHLEIVNVIPGGSAQQGGITKGDRITAVDDQPVATVGPERAADMLRGPAGSQVALTIAHDGPSTRTIRLTRRRVEIPSVEKVHLADRENGVGYIRISNFQKNTPRDFDAALWQLQRQGMRSLIVDLRGNPGGLLTASVELADRFISSGIIVSTKGRNPIEDYTHRARMGGTWRVPLTVLVDENSASASEIFAAAIRDHQRGTIVGRTSYGKGSVQGIFPLNIGDGGIRLTTAKFYSPNGSPINQVGVKPHVTVQVTARPGTAEAAESAVDNDLRIAVQVARRQVQTSRQLYRSPAVAGR